MSNVPVKFSLGAPAVSLKWPADAIISPYVKSREDGRWVAIVAVNGVPEYLPGTFPTHKDALETLELYVAERRSTQ